RGAGGVYGRFLRRASGPHRAPARRGARVLSAGRAQPPFYDDFYGGLVRRLGVRRALETDLSRGVTAGLRIDGEHDYVFVQNFTGGPVRPALDGREYMDMESGEAFAPG